MLRDANMDVERELLQAISSKSFRAYRHPLGFVNFDLESGRSKRIHVWQDGPRVQKYPAWPVHDHAYDFISLVLVGRVGNQEFEEISKPYTHRVYCVEYDGIRSVVRRSQDRVSLASKTISWCHAGQTYSFPRKRFHQSVVFDGEYAATLLLVGEKGSDSPRVAVPIEESRAPEVFAYESIPNGIALDMLIELKERMAIR